MSHLPCSFARRIVLLGVCVSASLPWQRAIVAAPPAEDAASRLHGEQNEPTRLQEPVVSTETKVQKPKPLTVDAFESTKSDSLMFQTANVFDTAQSLIDGIEKRANASLPPNSWVTDDARDLRSFYARWKALPAGQQKRLSHATYLYRASFQSRARGNFAEAQIEITEAKEIFETLHFTDVSYYGLILGELCACYGSVGEFKSELALNKEHLRVVETTLSKRHYQFGVCLTDLSRVECELGNLEQAITDGNAALCVFEKSNPPAYREEVKAFYETGRAYRLLGELDSAGVFFAKSQGLAAGKFGDSDYAVYRAKNGLALVDEDRGDFDKASVVLEAGLKQAKSIKDEVNVAFTGLPLGRIQRRKGHLDVAQQLLQDSLDTIRVFCRPDHPFVAEFQQELCDVYIDRKEYERAKPMVQHVLEVRRKSLLPTHPELSRTLKSYATVLKNTGEAEKAKTLDDEALQIDKNLRAMKDHVKAPEVQAITCDNSEHK